MIFIITLELLQESKYPEAFNLYNTRDNGVIIPKDKYGVILLVDRATNGLESLSNLNIGTLCKYIYLPKQVSIYNKRFSVNRSQYSSIISQNGLAVIQSPKAVTHSFILDVTPYVSFLFNRFNIYKYAIESMKFINNTINALNSEMIPNTINKWVMLYCINDKYINSQTVFTDKQLYGYGILKNIMVNNKQAGCLGILDDIFLCHIGTNGTNVLKIYDKQQPCDYSKIRSLILSIKPNFEVDIEQEKKSEDQQQSSSQQVNNNLPNKEDLQKLKQPVNVDNKKADSEIPDQNIYEKKSFTELFKNANQIYKQYSLSTKNTDIPEQVSNVVIKRIDDSQYDEERDIPIYSDEDFEIANKIINQDNDKMFPFLNHTKVKNSNFSDITSVNVKEDKEGKIVKLLNNIVPQLTNDKTQEKAVYDVLYSRLVRDPDLLEKSLKSYENKDLKQLLAYINNDHLPYNSKIYPKKEEVDRQVIRELDEWSNENGCLNAVSSDRVLNSDIISNLVNTNIHRVIAQKQLTWNNMPNEVEGYIKKLLENNGFQLIDVSMVDKKPSITQIEPTYKSEIRIRIRNKNTRVAQTLVFDVPTLIDGKYHISGGIKWLFPNVIATLPIFVVRPGRVQFRTSYSAISFQHHTTSKADTVTIFASGVNMPLLIWLLQFNSFDYISKSLGFNYKVYDDKKETKGNQFIISLPGKSNKVLGINITENANQKLIKGILIDLQALCNKLNRYNIEFDLYSYDKEAEYIQLYNQKKRNLAYSFDQIKKYMIDKRTEEILIARGIEPDLYKVSVKCANISINDVNEERLSINNTNLRLMDLVPSEIEKALHYAISEYKRRRLINPDAKLIVNSGWVINELRKQSVLLLYKDGNMTIENAQLTGARIVGPGGFGNVDMVQIADRNIVPDHFGILDPVDTAEGNPGIQLSLTTAFEYDPKNKIFSEVRANNSYKGLFGTATSQVPFVSSDDGNRVQFGGSQGRQVVPILGSESPLVGTGMEAYLPNYASSKFVKKSPVDGRVAYIDDKVIIIRDARNRSYMVNIMPSDLQTGAGKYNGLEHTPVVQVGDIVKKNQHLVTNQFVKPTYSAGCNILACYKPESGYTYDDGIVVSESFAKKYTSLHYQNVDIRVSHVSELVEFPLFKFKKDGNMEYEAGETIIKIKKVAFGGFSEDEVVAPVKCKVIDIQVFPADQSFNNLIQDIENTFYSKTNNALRMSGLDSLMNSRELIMNSGKYEFRKNKLDTTLIRIKLIEYRSIGLGDKLTNRHGAKGVVAQIMPDDQMPVIPDGRHVDVCLNPLGVISRMNIGQLIEMHVGNILDSARIWLKKNESNLDNCISMLSKLFTLLDPYEDKRLSEKMIAYINALPKQNQIQVVQDYIKNGIRMIFPAFETPKMESVYEAAKLVNAQLEAKLYLPKYGRYTMNEVTFGTLYILKLEHISSMKQNTRSIGKLFAA